MVACPARRFQASNNRSSGIRARKLASVLFSASLVATMLAGPALADSDANDGNAKAIRLLKTIPVPGVGLVGFDISWVDADSQTYFLADRSNAAVQVVDAKTGTYLRAI